MRATIFLVSLVVSNMTGVEPLYAGPLATIIIFGLALLDLLEITAKDRKNDG